MIYKITALFLLISFHTISQEKVFIDENMKEIDSLQFNTICKNRAYKCLAYSSDSILVNKVLPKYSFGKITPQEYDQIRSILELDSKTKVVPGSKIVISYSDTLFNKETIIKNQMGIFNQPNLSNNITFISNGFSKVINPNKDLDRRDFIKFNEKIDKYLTKCIENFEKQDLVSVNYVYNKKQDGITYFENTPRLKDRGIFKNTFFKIHKNYKLLVLKPDGEYFLSGGYMSNKNVQLLLKNDDWSPIREDLQEFIIRGCYIKYNFFEDPFYGRFTKNCF
ncbi:hypothetical protein KO494_04740 [Lacinutrix sp. C3R15]|uniref:hypothetical protein n=1 Tax=Flavobacteriaceae TaxID=49546 RepID=UPI001C08825F|nr:MULTISPECIES: hypothetical protein [Flavobacteriaceae]MBU2938844.1 hypothetical protein [Lacinutrix sp. C3R15]MDO6622157.1 hypothetical protein [Oceanihabitans sp. 1_MG-2023]